MNDLFSGSFSRFRSEEHQDQHHQYSNQHHHTIQMTEPPSTGAGGGINLDKLFEDVESIKDELKDIKNILRKLLDYHEQSKTLRNANGIKDLRTRMQGRIKEFTLGGAGLLLVIIFIFYLQKDL